MNYPHYYNNPSLVPSDANSVQQQVPKKSDAFIDSLIIPASPWEKSGGYLTNSNTSHNQ